MFFVILLFFVAVCFGKAFTQFKDYFKHPVLCRQNEERVLRTHCSDKLYLNRCARSLQALSLSLPWATEYAQLRELIAANRASLTSSEIVEQLIDPSEARTEETQLEEAVLHLMTRQILSANEKRHTIKDDFLLDWLWSELQAHDAWRRKPPVDVKSTILVEKKDELNVIAVEAIKGGPRSAPMNGLLLALGVSQSKPMTAKDKPWLFLFKAIIEWDPRRDSDLMKAIDWNVAKTVDVLVKELGIDAQLIVDLVMDRVDEGCAPHAYILIGKIIKTVIQLKLDQ